MAQALALHTKYQIEGGPYTPDLFSILGVDREVLFDRIVFAWIVGNCDAHAKNTSILEPGTERARLAPIYDMLSTECYEELDRTLATSIGRAVKLDAGRPGRRRDPRRMDRLQDRRSDLPHTRPRREGPRSNATMRRRGDRPRPGPNRAGPQTAQRRMRVGQIEGQKPEKVAMNGSPVKPGSLTLWFRNQSGSGITQ